MSAGTGDTVEVHDTGRFEDGTVFDSSRDREPIEFEVGSSDLIIGASRGVEAMRVGEERSVAMPPESACGERNDTPRETVERALLPADAKVGDQLMARSGDTRFPVWVVELSEKTATLDGNHPFAGMPLVFDQRLIAIEKD